MICFYHRGDLDGHCAGAIVRHRFPDTRMLGLDYEDEFPWQEIARGSEVCMVDFSLPMEDMKRLQELTNHCFLWIDHHKTAIDKAREAGFSAPGYQHVGKAACELTWKRFFPTQPMPQAVRLLGRYDVWDESQLNWQTEILPFQYGLRINPTDPSENKNLWDVLLDAHPQGNVVGELIKTGSTILAYQHQENIKLMARHSFYTRLDDLAAVAVNHGPGSSMKFEADPESKDFPLLISFARLPQAKWLVNLYTFREDVDCGEIARRHGGGGHQKAAGFICEALPFKI